MEGNVGCIDGLMGMWGGRWMERWVGRCVCWEGRGWVGG